MLVAESEMLQQTVERVSGLPPQQAYPEVYIPSQVMREEVALDQLAEPYPDEIRNYPAAVTSHIGAVATDPTVGMEAGRLHLTAEQEVFFAENTQLVRTVLSNISIRSWDKDEALQAGMIGLVDAIKRFDPERGASFSTYAKQRIKGQVIDWIRDNAVISRSDYKHMQIVSELESTGLTAQEIAKTMGMGINEYHELRHRLECSKMVSFESLLAAGMQGAVEQPTASDELSDYTRLETEIYEAQAGNVINRAMDVLSSHGFSQRNIGIVEAYLNGSTLKDAAGQYGLCESSASKIFTRAVRLLRAECEEFAEDWQFLHAA